MKCLLDEYGYTNCRECMCPEVECTDAVQNLAEIHDCWIRISGFGAECTCGTHGEDFGEFYEQRA